MMKIMRHGNKLNKLHLNSAKMWAVKKTFINVILRNSDHSHRSFLTFIEYAHIKIL